MSAVRLVRALPSGGSERERREDTMLLGATLGSYRVVQKLGEGGMGEVYRAYDTTLRRYVAIKVLPTGTVSDVAAAERLRAEARTLAALNHPNIASVFGLEEVDGKTIIIMELIEGVTLAERLHFGRIPLLEAYDIARQIADALEAAHAIGVVHRDIKPSNIKLTPDKRVKVLDFGLARIDAALASLSTDETNADLTRLAGTPSYMSPEQARGQATDTRTDIWAFGCVVYELITGRRAFEGKTTTDIIAAVLEREPLWVRLPGTSPPAIHRLLQRCLQKDRNRRLRHIADARLDIDDAMAQPAPARAGASPRRWLAAAGLITVIAVATGGWWAASRQQPAEPAPSPRFGIELSDALPLDATRQSSVALSPDGWKLVFVGERHGERVLVLQTLGRFDAAPLVGTEGAEGPFFSPDSAWIGFSAAGKMKKISLRNRSVVTICDAADPRGATWGDDDVITFAAGPFTGLARVSAEGGTPTPMTSLAEAESTHRWPQAAPGGKEIFFTIGLKDAPSFDDADVAVHSVEQGQTRRLVKGTFPKYVSTGHLVYIRGGDLLAARLDRSQRVIGQPFVAVERVGARPFSGTGWYAVAPSGTLVYASAIGTADQALVWVDRAGNATAAIPYQKAYASPRLSPDGARIVVTIYETDGTPDLWIYEMKRGTMMRLTSDGLNIGPSWSPDGKLIAFTSRRPGDEFYVPWVVSPDGGNAQRLRVGQFPSWVTSWDPTGQRLAVSQLRPSSGIDILLARLDGTADPDAFVATRFSESNGVFSPDGRWMAYVSDESKRLQVYLRDLRHPERRWQLSTDGGSEPVWAPAGDELFFRRGAQMMAVSITEGRGGQLAITQPTRLFEASYEQDAGSGHANFDVAGRPPKFLMVQNIGGRSAQRMTIVLNWLDELRQQTP